jgi:HAD superfamily hydrolase (TIGR01548 family)
LFENYLQKNDIFIRKDIISSLVEIDTIIFDIDGVLVDVSSSYYQTIIDTVQYYFSSILKIPGKHKLVDKQMIDSFKIIGGFNNDWELTAAAVLYYLWKMEEQQLKSTEELSVNFPIISEFINKSLSDGGGLSQLVSWISKHSSDSDTIFSLWDREKIFRIAKEFYAGEKYCFRLYGFHPSIVGTIQGNIKKEVFLIKPEIMAKLKKYNIGILTGRNRAETDFIIGKIEWEAWLEPDSVVTAENNMIKPSPAGLEYLLHKFQSKQALFVGDTMDDLMTVRNFNSQSREKHCFSALVLGQDFKKNDEYKEHYLKNNVAILAGNVNQVIKLLENNRYKNFNEEQGG